MHNSFLQLYLCRGEGCISQSLESISEQWSGRQRKENMSFISTKDSTVLTQSQEQPLGEL